MSAVGIVVGNPKPQSRTLAVAREVARQSALTCGLDPSDCLEIDLAGFASRLFDWDDDEVRGVTERVAATSLLVVASPTYKATYTGLLKAFLDWYPTTGLSGVVAVPVMVGAGEAHALAVEVHLRPLLVEIGAMVPARGLYVTEDRLGELDTVVEGWLVEAAPKLRAAVGGVGR